MVAVVHIGHAAPIARYAVVSSTAFDDIVYLNVLGNVFSYEMAHEDEDSPVTITIHSDNTVEYDSRKYGKSERIMDSRGATCDLYRQSGPMLKARMNVASQNIPGPGPGHDQDQDQDDERVVVPSGARAP